MTAPEEHRQLEDTRKVIMETKKLLHEVTANQEKLSRQLDLLDEVIAEKYKSRRPS